MVAITFIGADGARLHLDAIEGASLMMAAITAGVEGVTADCGGGLACGTCHLYLGQDILALIPPPAEAEAALLDGLIGERRAGSRLGCQVAVGAAMAGAVVQVPAQQG